MDALALPVVERVVRSLGEQEQAILIAPRECEPLRVLEEPDLFDAELEAAVRAMLEDAIACETQFGEDLLAGGIAGLSVTEVYGANNPFGFLALQDVQEVTNFFERRVSAYQIGVAGEVTFDAAF